MCYIINHTYNVSVNNERICYIINHTYNVSVNNERICYNNKDKNKPYGKYKKVLVII